MQPPTAILARDCSIWQMRNRSTLQTRSILAERFLHGEMVHKHLSSMFSQSVYNDGEGSRVDQNTV